MSFLFFSSITYLTARVNTNTTTSSRYMKLEFTLTLARVTAAGVVTALAPGAATISARRTSGEESSSNMIIAPSAAARSSMDKSE